MGTAVTKLRISDRDGAVRLSVRIKPRASRSRVQGLADDGALQVAVKAPPVEGAANDELVKLLAKALGVKRSAVRVVVGASSRNKVIEVRGLDRRQAIERLGLRSEGPAA